jgi:hypothetical protein
MEPPRSAAVMAPTASVVMPAAVAIPHRHGDGYQAAREQDADQRDQGETKRSTHANSDGRARSPIRRAVGVRDSARSYPAQRPTPAECALEPRSAFE